MKIRHKFTAFSFFILILLPTLDQLLGLSLWTSTENRQLKQVPTLEFPHVRIFAHQFDWYYKENFGWRNALFYAISNWKYNALNQSALPEKVIAGKEGWLFLGNSYNRVVDQHRGLKPLPIDSARYIASHLIQRQRELRALGTHTPLYVLVPPDSHTIYSEYLPDYLPLSSAPSRLDVLSQAINQTDLHFVDIRDTLRAAKRHHVVYYQSDTHWNEYGTLVGCATLLDQIRRTSSPCLPVVRLSNYQVEERQRAIPGDLVTMLMLQNQHPNDRLCYIITPAPHYAGQKIAVVPNPASPGLPSTRFVGHGCGKLLLVGDSFSEGMMQYLAGYFRESYFVRDRRLDPALLKSEKPDVVVIEVVERNLDHLATF